VLHAATKKGAAGHPWECGKTGILADLPLRRSKTVAGILLLEISRQRRGVEPVPAYLPLARQQHRHILTIALLKFGMRVNIDYIELKPGAGLEWRQCRPHVIAQVAPTAA
jgi:hypothetical protein